MRIIIVGDGKVGDTLTEYLSREGHDVVVIDNRADRVEAAVNQYDVAGLCGNGACLSVQMEAGISHSDLLIAATSSDELNILCCLVARHAGAKNTIARVCNPDYFRQLDILTDDLGLSMAVNPDFEAAAEAARVLRFPSAIQLETFAKGRLTLAEVRIEAGSPLIGMPLRDLAGKYRVKVLVCAVQRGSAVSIPDGSFVVQAGDHIHVTGAYPELAVFFKALGIFRERPHNVLIVGGGRIAFFLARQLAESGIGVRIIEQNERRCQELSELLPKAEVVCGDGTMQALLEEEGIRTVDALCALTGIDEENIIISMFAYTCGVRKVITKINRMNFMEMLETVGIDTIVSPKLLAANRILRYVRAMQNSVDSSSIIALHRLIDGKAEALEFVVSPSAPFIGVTLNDLTLKKNLLIAAIIRQGKIIIPGGHDMFAAGDSVIVLTAGQYLKELGDILA